MRDLKAWGRSVKALRLERGWSQTTLATKAKTPQQHIARIEAGRSAPSDDLKVRIAVALGENPSDLFPLVVDETAVGQAS